MKILTLILGILSMGLAQEDAPEGQIGSFATAMGYPIPPNGGAILSIDGQNTLITKYPYQVSIMYDGIHWCGGSILSKYYVITAAHCTDDFLSTKSKLSIRAGSSYQGTGGTIYSIFWIKQHPDFSYDTMDYDIAVIRTTSKIIYDASKQPISLATRLPYAGTFGVVTGWGNLDSASSTAYQLQELELPVVPRRKCISSYVDSITDRMFCAGYMEGGRGTCNHDSGGPLVVNGKLIGLVSFGIGCARENYPTVYTNVPYFYNWINWNTIF